VIRCKFPSLNEIVALAKSHWARYSEIKRRLTLLVYQEAQAAGWRPVTVPVIVRLYLIEANRRRDLDGCAAGTAKPVLDGLVWAGVLKNDTRRWVRGLEFRFPEPDKMNPRVEVELISLERRHMSKWKCLKTSIWSALAERDEALDLLEGMEALFPAYHSCLTASCTCIKCRTKIVLSGHRAEPPPSGPVQINTPLPWIWPRGPVSDSTIIRGVDMNVRHLAEVVNDLRREVGKLQGGQHD